MPPESKDVKKRKVFKGDPEINLNLVCTHARGLHQIISRVYINGGWGN